MSRLSLAGDHVLNPDMPPAAFAKAIRRAAVLVGVVDRPSGPAIVLTKRTETLRVHAGQIAFPGGKIDEGDAGPSAAALREANEEVGLAADLFEPLGYLDVYETGTGYRVVPVVGIVDGGFSAIPEPGEVEEVFEVPLGHVAELGNYELMSRDFAGRTRYFYAIEHSGRTIWGATAGILRNFATKVFAS